MPNTAWCALPLLCGPFDPGHLNILLVEDDAVNQEVAKRILSSLGYQADLAANGLEALKALESHRYDIILMDIQMPELDGLQATKAIRSCWPPEDQPYIIAVTAFSPEYSKEMCFQAGMDHYLRKPLKQEELQVAIGRSGSSA